MRWRFRLKKQDKLNVNSRLNKSSEVQPKKDLVYRSVNKYEQNNRKRLTGQDKKTSKPKQHSKFINWLAFVVLCAVLVVLLIGLYLSSNAKVIIVQPNGYNYMPHSFNQYQKIADNALNSSIYNHFKITISSADVDQQIEQAFPEINDVVITIPVVGSQPTVYIQLTKPALIYSTTRGNYVLDDNGIVIAGVASFKPKDLTDLPVVDSSLNGQLKNGQLVLSALNVNFIQTISLGLKAKNIAINKMVLISGAEELDVYPANQQYFIKFNIHQTDALEQLGTYLATIANLNKQNITPKDYIDVRVEGRVYYK